MSIDEQLIRRLADRDKQALSEIYDRYHLLIWNFAQRFQAEPAACEKLVQLVFNELWIRPEDFKNGRQLSVMLIKCCKSKMEPQQNTKESC
jgi:DNA-directed RNA polymerase specialized sigma24 family protein